MSMYRKRGKGPIYLALLKLPAPWADIRGNERFADHRERDHPRTDRGGGCLRMEDRPAADATGRRRQPRAPHRRRSARACALADAVRGQRVLPACAIRGDPEAHRGRLELEESTGFVTKRTLPGTR